MAEIAKTYNVPEAELRGCVTIRFVRVKPSGWFNLRRFASELAITVVRVAGVYRVEFDHDDKAAEQVYKDAIRNG